MPLSSALLRKSVTQTPSDSLISGCMFEKYLYSHPPINTHSAQHPDSPRILMNIKYRINASRAAYRKALKQTSKSYLQDELLASHAQETTYLLQRAEQSFDLNEMAHPQFDTVMEEQIDSPEKPANKQNILYKQFMQATEGSHGLLELEKLSKWKKAYDGIILLSHQRSEKMIKQILDNKDELRSGYFAIHNHYHASRAAQNASETEHSLQSQKDANKRLEKQIRLTKKLLLEELSLKTDFICKLIKDGIYQQRGLIWLLEELSDHNNEINNIFSPDKGIFQPKEMNKISKIQFDLTQVSLPAVLDEVSRMYLLNQFHEEEEVRANQKRIYRDIITQSRSRERNAPLLGASYFSEANLPVTQYDSLSLPMKLSGVSRDSHIWGKSIFNNSSLDVRRKNKSSNFDTKKIYFNTRDILSQLVCQTTKNPEIPSDSRWSVNSRISAKPLPSIKEINQDNPEDKRSQSLARKYNENPNAKIENRSRHRKRTIPLSNHLKSPTYKSCLMLGEGSKQREKRRIDGMYPPADRSVVRKLLFGVEIESEGLIGEIEYLCSH